MKYCVGIKQDSGFALVSGVPVAVISCRRDGEIVLCEQLSRSAAYLFKLYAYLLILFIAIFFKGRLFLLELI